MLLIDNVFHNIMLFMLLVDQCNHFFLITIHLHYHKVLPLLLFPFMLSIEVVKISIHLFIESIFVFIIILYKIFEYKMIERLMSEVIARFVSVEATTSSMGGKWL